MTNSNKYDLPQGSLISYMSNKVKKYGGYNLAQGIPGFEPPKELLNILTQKVNNGNHQYAPGFGNEMLLNLLANHYQIPNQNILITQGATEAIALIYIYLSQLKGNQLNVMSFDPSYESYNNLPSIFKHNYIPFYLTNNFDLDLEQLEIKVQEQKIDLLLLSSPGNPLGKCFAQYEVDKILEWSIKYNFFVVFDGVYKHLYFNKPPFVPDDIEHPKLFYVNSFSKMLSITGWRIGYFSCSSKHMDKIKSIHDYIGLCAPSLFQESIADYLESFNFAEAYTLSIRSKIRSSFHYMQSALLKMRFEIPKIQGGYFIWAKLPNPNINGFKFVIDLYEAEKVALIPGIHFSDQAEKYVRINIAHELNIIKEATAKIENFVVNQHSKTIK